MTNTLERHLAEFWPQRSTPLSIVPNGAINRSIADFKILVFRPATPADAWGYVSIGAWRVPTQERARFEFVVTSPVEDAIHIETLAMVSHFHADPRYVVHPGKVLAIGRPWMASSSCDHLLVSLPFPFGPAFETCRVNATEVRFLWLLPITAPEAEFAKLRGVDALENLFERRSVDTLDVGRASVV